MHYFTYKLKEVSTDELMELVGANDVNLYFLRELYNCDITMRNDDVLFFSSDEDLFNHFKKLIDNLLLQIKGRNSVDINFIKQTFLGLNDMTNLNWQKQIAGYTFNSKPIKYKTYNQYHLYKNILENDLVFSLGPAGTGKTFIGVVCACNAFKNGEVKKIILTRPAVEAGENLGFLPGDLKEKVDPYLMPLYDALYDILGDELVEKML